MRLKLVPARTGLRWVREGVRAFRRYPLAFFGLFVMFLATTVVLSMLPWIGTVLALALVPAATVGLMSASQQAVAGQFPLPVTLLTAFRQSPGKTRAMLVLGGLYALAVLLVVSLTALFGDGQFAQLMAKHDGQITPELMTDPALQAAARASMRQMIASGLLYLPVAVLFWHAPALVHWHQVPVGKSLFFSTVAVLRNAPAYLVYGAGWMLLATLAWLLLMLLAGLLGNLGLAISGMLPVSLVIAAMFYASLWFTFEDSFASDDTSDAPAA